MKLAGVQHSLIVRFLTLTFMLSEALYALGACAAPSYRVRPDRKQVGLQTIPGPRRIHGSPIQGISAGSGKLESARR